MKKNLLIVLCGVLLSGGLFGASDPAQKKSFGKESGLGARLPELSDFANEKPNIDEIAMLRAQCKETESALRILYPHGKRKKRSPRDRQLVIAHLERCEKFINKVPSWSEDLEFKQWDGYFKTIKRINKARLSVIKYSKKREEKMKNLEEMAKRLRKEIATLEIENAELRQRVSDSAAEKPAREVKQAKIDSAPVLSDNNYRRDPDPDSTMTEEAFDKLMNADKIYFLQ